MVLMSKVYKSVIMENLVKQTCIIRRIEGGGEFARGKLRRVQVLGRKCSAIFDAVESNTHAGVECRKEMSSFAMYSLQKKTSID